MPRPDITLSIVSHGQAALIRPLLADLRRIVDGRSIEILLTINIPEDEAPYVGHDLPLIVRRNAKVLGFGANHNAAFRTSSGNFFVVVNPDIRTPHLDMDPLLAPFADQQVGACAPLVKNSAGVIQNSARRFPTVGRLARHILLGSHEPDYSIGNHVIPVDWVAGMFTVYRRKAFDEACGFDDRRFFMYYEDVDLCTRLRRSGWTVVLQPNTVVTHDAQRASHRNFRHLRWHVASAVRYLSGL